MDTAQPLRRGLLLLAALGAMGTAVELAMTRHWTTLIQMIPWFALGVLVVAVVMTSAGQVRMARLLAVIVFLSAAYGIYEHTLANFHAGPLDFRYTAKWETMTTVSRWWAAFTESVGPSPTLAPLVLAWTALCVLLATLGLRRSVRG